MNPAERTRIARVELPRLGVGTASLGDVFGKADEDAAAALLRTAIDAGTPYIDTAPLYGNGLSERRIGAALRELSQPDIVLSTKVGRILDDSTQGWHFDFSREGILRSLESSLDRLGRDRVDIVYLHDPDDHEEELYASAWPTLVEMREQGTVSAIGVGMNQWQIPLRLIQREQVDLVMLAGRHTLLDNSAATAFLPACLERGVGVVAAGVFNSGILIDPIDGAWFDYRPAQPQLLERARRIRDVLSTHGVDLSTAALHYASGHPAVVSTVVGVGSERTLRRNLAGYATDVPAGAWAALVADGLIAAAPEVLA